MEINEMKTQLQRVTDKQFLQFKLHHLHHEKSIQGIIGFGHFPNEPLVAFKVMSMSMTDVEFYLHQNHTYQKGKEIREHLSMSPLWMEFYILQECRNLLLMDKTIHVPHCLGYKYVWDGGMSSVPFSLDHPSLILFSEKADGNLKDWCLEKDHSVEEWNSVWGQLVFGLLCLQYYMGVIHNDFHWGNILVYPQKTSPRYWKYTYHAQDYYIPHFGQRFVPWDFAMSCIYPDIIGKTDMISDILCQDIFQFSHVPLWIQKERSDRIIPSMILSLCHEIRTTRPLSHQSLLVLLNQYFQWDRPDDDDRCLLCKSFQIN